MYPPQFAIVHFKLRYLFLQLLHLSVHLNVVVDLSTRQRCAFYGILRLVFSVDKHEIYPCRPKGVYASHVTFYLAKGCAYLFTRRGLSSMWTQGIVIPCTLLVRYAMRLQSSSVVSTSKHTKAFNSYHFVTQSERRRVDDMHTNRHAHNCCCLSPCMRSIL